jgi:hypothetical protein
MMESVTAMRRIPMTLRALVLVPLLAAVADHARTVVCPAGGQTCFEAAAGGPGTVAMIVYALALALLVGRLARGGSLLRLWLLGTLGTAAVVGGQALLAGDASALGGGWPELLAFCAVAGGVLAAALRVVPALVRQHLRPAAPRPFATAALTVAFPALPAGFAGAPRTPATAGRAPPVA